MERYFSDLLIDFLKQHAIDYVSFNPGASFRGVHDSLVHNDNSPEIIMACHEEIAVSIAHGYYKATNQHMAVFLHANVGLLHGSMAIFNAWCDRVPLLLIGGNGPIDAAKRRPWIDWIHTSQNIESVVKDFVKWCDQPTSQKATLESLYRAFKIMNTEMQAPCFIAVDFDVQEQEIEPDVKLLPRQASNAPKFPAADTKTILALTEKMLSARFPVLILDFSGRNKNSVAAIIELAESVGFAVIDRGNRFNFPNNHPLNISNMECNLLSQADFIFAVEVQDLAGALASLNTGCQLTLEDTEIYTLSTHDTWASKWAADYQQLVPVTESIIADTVSTIELINQAIAGCENKNSRQKNDRVSTLKSVHLQAKKEWFNFAQDKQRQTGRMHVSTAVMNIYDAIKDNNWVLTNSGSLTIDGWVKKLWNLTEPGCYLGLNGGGGLGYGLGASIGAALGNKDKDILHVNLQADGDFLYTPSALWTLSSYEIPLLVIVMNNRLYFNSTQHAEKIASARNRTEDLSHVATSFYEAPVDFLKLAEGFNIKTYPRIDKESDIFKTIAEAADFVMKNKKPALVEVLMQ